MKKVCPACAAQYDEHVSFCFVDGTSLGPEQLEPTPAPVPRRTPAVARRLDEAPAPRGLLGAAPSTEPPLVAPPVAAPVAAPPSRAAPPSPAAPTADAPPSPAAPPPPAAATPGAGPPLSGRAVVGAVAVAGIGVLLGVGWWWAHR